MRLKVKSFSKLVLILTSLLILASLISIFLGSKMLSLQEIVRSFSSNSFNASIIKVRIPRIIFSMVAGVSLAISGLLMQKVTRNPISDASVLGINAGASLFVVIGLRFFHIASKNMFILLALLGGLTAALCVYLFAYLKKDYSPLTITLAGIAVSISFMSLVNTIMLPDNQVMESFRFWQVGSLGAINLSSLLLFLPYFIIGLILSFIYSKKIDMLALGDEYAATLGMKVKETKLILLFISVLLSSSVTALAGPIGFMGLMVPHIVTMFYQKNTFQTMIITSLMGALLLVNFDTFARVILSPQELEVGIITSSIGSLIFIYVVKHMKGRTV